nr:helix-turn-helix transcriptional regulator [Paenibacillus tritici]
MARDIDYRLGAVQDLYNDTMERYPRELLSRITTYLECSISDLLINEETPPV